MWDLKIENPASQSFQTQFPIITYEWLFIILSTLILLHLLIRYFLSTHFKITTIQTNPKQASLEYSPFYHLSIIILILSEINWNIFDLAIWILVYIGVGIIRTALYSIKQERQTLINSYNYDSRLSNILKCSKIFGSLLFFGSLFLFVSTHIIFLGINMKIINMLVFPLMMLTIDGLFLFMISVACQKDILVYFNHNINQVLPTYQLEMVEKITCNSVRVWHYYNLIRFFIRTLIQKMGVLQYMWIFSIVNSLLTAVKTLYVSTGKYRNYNKLMSRFDRLFKKTTSAPDQNCPICLTELLNCKELSVCGHKFHYRCLLEWMQTKMHCPICRHPIEL